MHLGGPHGYDRPGRIGVPFMCRFSVSRAVGYRIRQHVERGQGVEVRRLGRALGAAAVAGWLGVFLLVVLSASCGHQGFLNGTEVTPTPSPTSSSTATAGPTATPTQGLVFATNNGDGKLSEFSRDLTSGALTLIGTTAVGAASGPTGLALSPSNSFLSDLSAGQTIQFTPMFI